MNGSQNDTLLSIYSSPRTVFSMASIVLMTGETREGVLSKRLNYYVREGRLLNPRRGFYAKADYNPEELACLIYTPSYLSLEYVLQRAGVVFQYDSRLTAVSYLSRAVDVEGKKLQYRRVKGELLSNTEGIICSGNINIATPERAFLDVLYLNADYYFDNLRPLSYKQINTILPLYSNKRMEKRVRSLFKKTE